MPEGSNLRRLVKDLIRETLREMATTEGKAFNEQGIVAAVNDNGTVDVQTSTSLYPQVGTPVVRTVGERVIVVTAEGKKVAL